MKTTMKTTMKTMKTTRMTMIKIIENKELKLEYRKGFGAWTYHIRIPGTAAIEGRWGFLKVSGTIDGYEIKSLNLAPRKYEMQ